MAALLKFELRKLFQNKALYICLGIALFLLIINTVTVKVMDDLMAEEMAAAYEAAGIKYETSFSALSLLKSTFNNNTAIVEGVIVSLIVCEDFASDVIKNVYSKGYTRSQVYFSKMISSFIAFFGIYLIGTIVSFTLGVILSGNLGKVGEHFAGSLVGIFLIVLAYFAIYYAISSIFKKIAPSIVFSILGPTGISILLILIDAFINNEKVSISDYWISGLMTNLSLIDVETKWIVSSIIVSILLIAGFTCLSFFFNRRKDAK